MSCSVLVVEDDIVARAGLTQILQRGGHHVVEVSGGAEAIELLGQRPFDIVLSDIRMREVDGLQVLEAALALANPPAVILLTGYSTVETAIAALRIGAADYLLKPCLPQVLIEAVDRALERRRATARQSEALRRIADGISALQRQLSTLAPDEGAEGSGPATLSAGGPALGFGLLQLGRFPHEVSLSGRQIRLTPIEYALLHCLVEAQGQVVDYSEIFKQTHGQSTSMVHAQMMLKSHVRNLRRRLGADLIENVRHVGYRLLAEQPAAPDEGAEER